jgi:hypothetical protein
MSRAPRARRRRIGWSGYPRASSFLHTSRQPLSSAAHPAAALAAPINVGGDFSAGAAFRQKGLANPAPPAKP